MATPANRKTKRLSLLGSLPDMRDWGSGPGLGGWGAEGEPGASATRAPENVVHRPDADVVADVLERLSRFSAVEVSVDRGEVTLTGTVADAETRLQIHELVEQVAGVREVSNRLHTAPEDPKTTASMGSE